VLVSSVSTKKPVHKIGFFVLPLFMEATQDPEIIKRETHALDKETIDELIKLAHTPSQERSGKLHMENFVRNEMKFVRQGDKVIIFRYSNLHSAAALVSDMKAEDAGVLRYDPNTKQFNIYGGSSSLDIPEDNPNRGQSVYIIGNKIHEFRPEIPVTQIKDQVQSRAGMMTE